MTQKLNRRYRLLINTNEGTIEIKDPLTIEFNITRGISSSLNQGLFKIYNLSSSTRSKLFQDYFRIKGGNLLYKQIIFQAGYNQLSTIFKGNLLQSFSFRKSGDIIQQIEAMDGGYGLANSFTSLTLAKGESYNNVLDKVTADLVNLEKGVFSTFDKAFNKAVSVLGNTVTELKGLFRDEADIFIDNERLSVLKTNEAVVGQIALINSESGLLSTPIRRSTYLQVEMVFEPRLTVGQIVEIKSSVNPFYDGQYKIFGITHTGIISGATAGELKTILQLSVGRQLINGLQTIEGTL